MRCVRFVVEIVGVEEIGVIGCGEDMEIIIYFEKFLELEFFGNVIDLCLVGVLILKFYVFMV